MPSPTYMDYSFTALVDKLKQKLKEKDSWKDVTESSIGTTLIELIAYAIQELVFFQQRAFEESFVDTAQFWESLVRLGLLIGYKVRRPRGATATIKLYPGSSDVTIPAGYTITINNQDWYFPEEVTVSASGDPVTATIRQGTSAIYSFTGTGQDFQMYAFGNEKTTDVNLKVYVGGVEWSQVDYISLANGTGYYELVTLPDKRMQIKFGTTDVGGAPLPGTSIEIHCYNTEGKNSNYYGTPDWDEEVMGLQAELLTPLTGGDDIESVEDLRRSIELAYRAKNGVVSVQDFQEFVESIPGVQKVYATDVKTALAVPFRVVRLYVLPEGGYELDDTLKSEIESQLNRISPVGIKVEVYSPLIRNVNVGVSINITSGFSTSSVKTAVENAIRDLYDPSNLEFGQWVTIQEIRNACMAVNGVSSASVYYPTDNITLRDYEFLRLNKVEVS